MGESIQGGGCGELRSVRLVHEKRGGVNIQTLHRS